LPILDECIAHTTEHFELEETWMARLNFPAAGCHVGEHKQVLGVMKQVRTRVAAGETDFAYVLATELSAWLRIHATTMDYALTYFIASTHADVSA
jgi:hemerythrin